MDTKDETDLRNLERCAQSFLENSRVQEMIDRLKPMLTWDPRTRPTPTAEEGLPPTTGLSAEPEPEPQPEPEQRARDC